MKLWTLTEPRTHRAYKAVWPAGAKSLIIALHGWKQTVDQTPPWYLRLAGKACGIDFDFLADSQLETFCEAKNCALALPLAKNGSWDYLDTDPASNEDLRYIEGVLASVLWHAETVESVYLYGFSQGAALAHVLLDHLGEQISGAVFHSGVGPKTDLKPILARLQERVSMPRGQKVAVVWGEKDLFVRLVGDWIEKDIVRVYTELGAKVFWRKVPGLPHKWWKDGNEDLWEFFQGM